MPRIMEKYLIQYYVVRHSVALSEAIIKSAPASILCQDYGYQNNKE